MKGNERYDAKEEGGTCCLRRKENFNVFRGEYTI